jgi:hypothetical protein
MASQTMSAAEIAELLDEAAAARQLAAVIRDTAAVDDLIAYAFALEASAATEASVPPQPGWPSEDYRTSKSG